MAMAKVIKAMMKKWKTPQEARAGTRRFDEARCLNQYLHLRLHF